MSGLIDLPAGGPTSGLFNKRNAITPMGKRHHPSAAGRAPGDGHGVPSATQVGHIVGTARMGGSADTAAVDLDGQTWDVENLHVADASCFPTASGVNPMISIESIAHMNATRLAAKLGS